MARPVTVMGRMVLMDDGSVWENTGTQWVELEPIPRTPAAGREADQAVRERAEAAGLHIPNRDREII